MLKWEAMSQTDATPETRPLSRRTVVLGMAVTTLFGATSGSMAAIRETIVTENGLEGSFVRPDGEGPFPATLIIAGSGPTDRDCNSPMVGLKTDAYLLLARSLAAAGIASLRYDKRGVGKSAASASRESDMLFGNAVDDAVTWVGWLGRQVGVRSVSLVGHSEGALIASVAAKRTPVTGVVVLEGSGRPMGDLIRAQLARVPMPDAIRTEANNILDALSSGRTVENVNPGLLALFRPSVQPFLISIMSVNPAEVLGSLQLPSLIVWGRRDMQVGEEDFAALAHARPDAEKFVLPTMNHTLKDVGEGREANLRAYSDPSLPLAGGLAGRLAQFITKLDGR